MQRALIILLLTAAPACFDSRRIVFRNREDFLDAGAGGAGGAPPQSQATGAVPPAPAPSAGARATAPGSVEATMLGAVEAAPLDAGGGMVSLDAAAPDAAE